MREWLTTVTNYNSSEVIATKESVVSKQNDFDSDFLYMYLSNVSWLNFWSMYYLHKRFPIKSIGGL